GPGEPAHAARPPGGPALVGAQLLVVRREPVRGGVHLRGGRRGPRRPCRGPEAARRAAQRAVDVSRRQGDRVHLAAALTELARTHSNLPSVSVVAQPSAACEAAAVEALAIALDADRPELVARSLSYRGEARMSRGDLGGFVDLEHAVELAVGDPRLETRVRCL